MWIVFHFLICFIIIKISQKDLINLGNDILSFIERNWYKIQLLNVFRAYERSSEPISMFYAGLMSIKVNLYYFP